MSEINPYEVTGQIPRGAGPRLWDFKIGLIAIMSVFAIAVIVGVMEPFMPRVRSFTMPRFGGCLIMCANPIIFLISAIRRPTRTNLVLAGLMTVSIGVINAFSLWHTETLPIIQNEFTQRLHSSWLWAVLPFFLAAGYIFLTAAFSSSKPVDPKGNKP